MPDLSISRIDAREVLDCRGLPTVQVDLDARRRHARPRRRALRAARPARTRRASCATAAAASAASACSARSPTSRPRSRPALVGEAGCRPARARPAPDRARRHRRTSRASAPTRSSASRWPPPAPPPPPPGVPLYRHLNANAPRAAGAAGQPDQRRPARLNDLDFQEFIVLPVGAREPAARAADRHRDQPGAGRDPARPLRQGRPQHRRRGRLRAADVEPARGARAPARGGRAGRATPADFVYGLDCAATHLYDAATEHLHGRRRALRPRRP